MDSEASRPCDLRRVTSPHLSFLVYKWKRKTGLDQFQGKFLFILDLILNGAYVKLVNVLTFSIVLLDQCAHFHNQHSVIGKTYSRFIDLRPNPHWPWANFLTSPTQLSQPGNEENADYHIKSLWGLEARHRQGTQDTEPTLSQWEYLHPQAVSSQDTDVAQEETEAHRHVSGNM